VFKKIKEKKKEKKVMLKRIIRIQKEAKSNAI